jgi:NAD(P)-dependent dehydrogenase (short-subunit alcohol dehydrogenase family)
MATSKRTALVTGASGLAGGYMLAHLLEQGGWIVVAVSRRKQKYRFEEVAAWSYPDNVFASVWFPCPRGHRRDASSDVFRFSAGPDHPVTSEKIGRTAAFHAPRRQ